jgi:DNA-binding GntR family transcriptional regulator
VYTQKILKKPRSQRGTSNLSDKAYKALRGAILDGKVEEGEVLFEVHLADHLGMSRTPVREVLQALTLEGLLEELPGKGYAVPRRSLVDLREFYELREVLESAATGYAAIRVTDDEIKALDALSKKYRNEKDLDAWYAIGSEFHDRVINASRNKRLIKFLDSLNAQIKLSRKPFSNDTPEWRKMAIDDHQQIFEAIKNRNEQQARQAAADHVRHAFSYMLRACQPD